MKRIGILIVLLIIVFAIPARGQIDEVYFGVDGRDLGLGGRIQISREVRLRLEYFESKGIGVGAAYKTDRWSADLFHSPARWQSLLSLGGVGSLKYMAKDSGEIDGLLSYQRGGLRINGVVSGDKTETDGFILGRYRWPGATLKGKWDFNEEDSRAENFSLSCRVDLGDDRLDILVQYNEYKAGGGLVGKGLEVLWDPGWDWLEFGAGVFEEKDANSSFQRYRFRVARQFPYRFDSSTLAVGGSVEGFVYSDSSKRIEASITGSYRQDWSKGYGELRVQHTRRAGETPFSFDDKPKKQLVVLPKIAQRVGSATSMLTAKYDATTKEWKSAQGNLEARIAKHVSARFSASYDLAKEPKEDESVFAIGVRYDRGVELRANMTFNYKVTPLNIVGAAYVTVRDGYKLGLEGSYDVREEYMESISANIEMEQIGTVSLDYNYKGPRIMARYQVARW